jgi:hypothetical protein
MVYHAAQVAKTRKVKTGLSNTSSIVYIVSAENVLLVSPFHDCFKDDTTFYNIWNFRIHIHEQLMRTLAFVTNMKNQLSSFDVSREGPSFTNLLTKGLRSKHRSLKVDFSCW